ncbi:type I restriction enzyme HsdR N-terminal domain-containing protein [Bacteroidia bacterium]|nr:type I restriction enzyme HsdR N-terminal domain-containing protein [Bacteroidia bacterium]
MRKKYIQLTPEEWVRQHIVSFLIEHKQLGKGLISIEKGTSFNGLKKRYDLKVYDNSLNLILLVECKAPSIKLTEETLIQSLTYAQSEKPLYIMLSNGLQHIYYDVVNKQFLEDLAFSGI